MLTVCGSLDGLARVTRCGAEPFFRQAGTDDPVVVVEGLSHAQFADGHASSAEVLARDLAPELPRLAANFDAHWLRAPAVLPPLPPDF